MTTIPDKYLIPKQLKLTTKYTNADYQKVKDLYKQGNSIHSINRETGMSRRLIQFILFPDRLKINKSNFAKRQKTGIYRYPTKVQSAMVAAVRKRKKQMLNKLKPKNGKLLRKHITNNRKPRRYKQNQDTPL